MKWFSRNPQAVKSRCWLYYMCSITSLPLVTAQGLNWPLWTSKKTPQNIPTLTDLWVNLAVPQVPLILGLQRAQRAKRAEAEYLANPAEKWQPLRSLASQFSWTSVKNKHIDRIITGPLCAWTLRKTALDACAQTNNVRIRCFQMFFKFSW